MADSSPRPSVAPPPPGGGGGGALIAVGVVLLLGAAGAILYFVNKRPPETPPPAPVATASTTAEPATTLDLPPIELPKDAGEDTAPDAPEPTKPKVAAGGGCPATCSGTLSDAARSALSARAASARQCYKSALEANEGLAGEVVVQVRIGLGGETCSATIASDTTGSQKLQQCVRSRMVATYPQPKGGCVDVKVPVVFKPKT